ncbi:DUF4280 domain-containing protein [Apibacter muscae]|uniref:DUF4280 domain-containing protein n=1 Tax=Apibacter muscae TaxID=2509004 RepID=UPI0011AC8FBA|nr:DUF4280 domain-containing protein [Apibacter muscae]TWP31075.1 DUF4280 domain-containing protein [Apibacter muscae]
MEEKHVTCQGAICQCTYGSTTDKLKVYTQTKHYINDKNKDYKLVATHKELGTTFENNSFGSCSLRNRNPCTVSVTGWNGFYEKVTLEENGGKALLEDSTADCPTGGKGCIKIIFHGQQAELCKANFHKVDSSICNAMNPTGEMEATQEMEEEIYDAE